MLVTPNSLRREIRVRILECLYRNIHRSKGLSCGTINKADGRNHSLLTNNYSPKCAIKSQMHGCGMKGWGR